MTHEIRQIQFHTFAYSDAEKGGATGSGGLRKAYDVHQQINEKE